MKSLNRGDIVLVQFPFSNLISRRLGKLPPRLQSDVDGRLKLAIGL